MALAPCCELAELIVFYDLVALVYVFVTTRLGPAEWRAVSGVNPPVSSCYMRYRQGVLESPTQDTLATILRQSLAQLVIEEAEHYVVSLTRFRDIEIIKETVKEPFPDVEVGIYAQCNEPRMGFYSGTQLKPSSA